MSYEDALKIISEGRETQFDPVITDAVIQIKDKFREISQKYR